MARKAAPVEPEWPIEHVCPDCGGRVYRVESQDGDEIVVDVDELETTRATGLLLEKSVTRMNFRHPAVRTVGGHRLLDPELFHGWQDEPLKWRWFSQRMGLEEAYAAEAPIHSEHVFTCAAVSSHALCAKVSNVAVIGSAAGDQLRKSRRLNLQAQAEHDREPSPEPEESEDSLPHPAAMDPNHRDEDHRGQLSLF
jgi:hypothetical protein